MTVGAPRAQQRSGATWNVNDDNNDNNDDNNDTTDATTTTTITTTTTNNNNDNSNSNSNDNNNDNDDHRAPRERSGVDRECPPRPPPLGPFVVLVVLGCLVVLVLI